MNADKVRTYNYAFVWMDKNIPKEKRISYSNVYTKLREMNLLFGI
ncbi:MAG: hypothetical protein ACREBJ_07580 [Nitrosotalea sp.]